jgi:hypothetical protein
MTGLKPSGWCSSGAGAEITNSQHRFNRTTEESQPIDPRPNRPDRRIDSPYRVELLPKLNKPQPNTPCKIGRPVFDFLGYHLTRRGLRAVAVTIEKSFAHVRRLYEQGADPIRIGQYVQRWRKWLTSGLGRLSVTCDDDGGDCIPPLRCSRMRAC